MAILQYNYQLVVTTPPEFDRLEDRTADNDFTFKFALDISVFQNLVRDAHERRRLAEPIIGSATSIKDAKRNCALEACRRLFELRLLKKPYKVLLVDQLAILELPVSIKLLPSALRQLATHHLVVGRRHVSVRVCLAEGPRIREQTNRWATAQPDLRGQRSLGRLGVGSWLYRQ